MRGGGRGDQEREDEDGGAGTHAGGAKRVGGAPAIVRCGWSGGGGAERKRAAAANQAAAEGRERERRQRVTAPAKAIRSAP
jgi:hypothetical protein